ncbi:MAG: FAD-dependent oxidoreductase [Bacillota bacterium]
MDVAVTGAGVVGAAIARRLAETGVRVTVLEASDFAVGASGANMGQLSLSDREPCVHLDLARDSLAEYRGETADIGYREDGGSIVLTAPDQLEPMRRLVARQRARGLDVRLVPPGEAARAEPHICPTALEGLAWCPQEGQVDPLALTALYLDRAAAAGADVRWHTPVIGWEWDASGSRLTAALTPQGPVRAGEFVLAAGAWTRELAALAGVELPIGYHRGALLVTHPAPPTLRGPVVGGGFLTPAFVRENSHVEIGLIQRVNGSIIIGQSTRHVEGYDTALVPGELGALCSRFVKLFPSLAGVEAVRAWAGVTPFTADRLPVFGPCRRPGNLFVAASFKGALSVAPAVGRHAAAAIRSGRMPREFAPFSPARFGA